MSKTEDTKRATARLREDDQVRELRSARSPRGINAYAPARQFVSTQAGKTRIG